METKLNDNEVKEVARMQEMIDTYETFIRFLSFMVFSKKYITIPLLNGTNLDKEMRQIWWWVKEHKENE